MSRAQNIAKTLILLTALLLAGTRYAYAQNTSAQPYIDSWHLYRVEMGSITNTVTWELQDALVSPTTTRTLTDGMMEGTEVWVDTSLIDNAALDSAAVKIKFVDALFNNAEIWYLVYSEWDPGSGGCIARRFTRIDMVENTFYLSLPGDDTDCNSFSGFIWDNTVDDLSIPNRLDSVEFTVYMNKDDLFLIDQWRFNGSFEITPATNTLAPIPFLVTAGSSAFGTWQLSGPGDNFNMVVTTPPDFGGETDQLSFWVYVLVDITSDYKIKLTISNGQAVSGNNYITLTDDNLTLGVGGKEVELTILGVPNTSIISVTP